MKEFSITTEETRDLGEQIGVEGNNFEALIDDIERAVNNCSSSWTNGGYEDFLEQTNAAAADLQVLRDFFRRFGENMVNFSNESQNAINKVSSVIRSNY